MLQAGRRDSELVIFALIVGGVLYGLLAYFLVPLVWRHYEHQKDLAGLTMITHTHDGIPGDPINVGAVGSEADLLCAMHAAQWFPADPVTLRSSVEIVGSVLLDRPYRGAPVSPLYCQGKRQDFAFEKPAGKSPDRRHHVRFWKVLDRGEEGRAVWLGAATFDRGVGFSHKDGRITHHIAPNVDADRDRSPPTLRLRRWSPASTMSPASDRRSTDATAAAIFTTPTARSKSQCWSTAAHSAPRPRRFFPTRLWSN